MTATTRVYLVFDNGTAVALIRAASQAQAIRSALADRFEAVPADQDMLIKYLPTMPVADAKAEPAA